MNTYLVRVRGKTYLWGGFDIEEKFDEAPPLLLTIRNDDLGEAVSLRTEWKKASGGKEDKKNFGVLRPGQSYTIKLHDLTGVYAVQADLRPTVLTCVVHREE